MLTPQVATVFGGTGFLGRYVVKRLRRAGHVVRVASRDPGGANHLRTMGPTGEVVPLYASFSQKPSITRAIEGAGLVVNLIGILAEQRSGDFRRLHAEGAGLIAAEARQAGVQHLTHVSASGDTRMQPVLGGDVADAVATTLLQGRSGVYELGGPDVMTFRAILRWILDETGRRRPLVDVPLPVARLQASILERLPGRMLTLDQLRLLAHDNVVSPGANGFAQLGIAPSSIDLIVPEYLSRYRAGGLRRVIPA